MDSLSDCPWQVQNENNDKHIAIITQINTVPLTPELLPIYVNDLYSLFLTFINLYKISNLGKEYEDTNQLS